METKRHPGVWALLMLTVIFAVFLMGFKGEDGDRMMLPDSEMDIIDTAVAAGNFTTLAAALEAAELIEPLKGEGPFTVFAPTDDAFAKLPPGTVDELLLPENIEKLASILVHHVVDERIVVRNWRLRTLNSDDIIISNQGTLTVNDAAIVVRNIPASNGIIHVIDTVLIPGRGETRRTAAKMIAAAIEIGVPLYNCNNQQACATVYRTTLEDLTDIPGDAITEKQRKMIRRVINETKDMDNASDQAWALRRVLDEISESLKHGMDIMPE